MSQPYPSDVESERNLLSQMMQDTAGFAHP